MTLKQTPTLVLATLFLFLSFSSLYAQGWERRFSQKNTFGTTFPNFTQTADQGYLAAGYKRDSINFTIEGSLLKTDVNGNGLWYKSYPNTSVIRDAIERPEGGYWAFGNSSVPSSNGGLVLLTLDPDGNLLSSISHGSGSAEGACRMVRTVDDGFVLLATTLDSTNNLRQPKGLEVLKIDSLGGLEWRRVYRTEWYQRAFDLKQHSDGGFLVSAQYSAVIDTSSPTGSSIIFGGKILKINTQGDIEWETSLGRGNHVDIHEYPDGSFIGAGSVRIPSTGTYKKIIRFDQNGDTLWTRGTGLNHVKEMVVNPDGTVCVVSDSLGYLMLTKMDTSGTLIWRRTYGDNSHRAGNLIRLSDGGYAIHASASILQANGTTTWPHTFLLRTDTNGIAFSNVISGIVYHDENSNCTPDSTERTFRNPMLKLTPGPRYVNADTAGRYEFRTDTGQFNVELLPYNPMWSQSCPAPPAGHTVTFPAGYDTLDNAHFGREIEIYCPWLTVELGSSLYRPCRLSTVSLNYSNDGTIDATNAYVEVALSPLLTLDSASAPYTGPTNGNTYRFDLGTIAPGQFGTIYLYTYTACSSVIDQAICNEAHIYPDTNCLPLHPMWSGASVEVDAECINNDTVRFSVSNVGIANMAAPGGVLVLEDIIMRMDSNVQLNIGETRTFDFPANGSTWSLRAEQVPFHPGDDRPFVALEGCGTNGNGDFTVGILGNLPFNDRDHFKAIHCREVVRSCDPNRKTVSPTGWGSSHFIEAVDQLEYTLDFQNIGTDTAFRVVLRDTLSPHLDPGSIVPGASSHPYSWQITGSGILEFTFDPIILPDSLTNEPASRGYVNFRIDQDPNNQIGDVIENYVDIYFDYNAPVATNEVFNTIGSDFLGFVSIDPGFGPADALSVYPNPFKDKVNFNLGRMSDGVIQFELVDLAGQKLRNFHFPRGDRFQVNGTGLASGMYLFRITESNGKILGTGRVVVQ